MNANSKWPEFTESEARFHRDFLKAFTSLPHTCTNRLSDVILPESVRCDNYFAAYLKLVTDEWKPLKYYLGESGDSGIYADDTELFTMAHHLPHVSVDDPTKVAFYQSPDKLRRGIETKIKPASYYKRYVNPHASESTLAAITTAHLNMVGGYKDLLRFADNDDLDTWGEVYRSGYIRSCMNNNNYNLTLLDTYQCYCTSAFGLPDNGLRLAWLRHSSDDYPFNAVARAIVHQPTMTYVRVYGDDRLTTALESAGYEPAGSYLEGLTLATWLGESEVSDEDTSVRIGFVHPYVDGSLCTAEFFQNQGKPYFKLEPDADYRLDSTHALVFTSESDGCEYCQTCPILGCVLTGGTYQVWYKGDFVEACEEAWENSVSADYLGDDIKVYNPGCTLDVMGSDGGWLCILDMEENHEYYGVVWSEYHCEYIYGDDTVYVEVVNTYAFDNDCIEIDDVWYLQDDCRIAYCEPYNEPALKQDCDMLNGLWFKLEDLEEVDGKTVPRKGLDDDLREEILNG